MSGMVLVEIQRSQTGYAGKVSYLSSLSHPPHHHTLLPAGLQGGSQVWVPRRLFFLSFFFPFQNLMSASLSTSLFVSHPF